MFKGSIKILATILVLSLPVPGNSQLTDLVYEAFSSPSKFWWTGKDETKSVQIADGKYKVHLISTKNGRLFHISIGPDFTKDFVLEATFRQLSGDDNSGIGFLWGYDPATGHNNSFCFTSTGYVRSWISDDLRKSEREWEEAQGVKPIGSENKLRVEKKGDQFKYILNSEVVITRMNLPIYGDKIGMVFYGDMQVWVDDFRYAEAEKPEATIKIPSLPELPVFYNEEYDDNGGEWIIDKKENYETQIADGKYHIRFLQPSGGHFFYKSISFLPNKDFEIQAQITQIESADDDGFGLTWGYKNPDNMYGFIIASDGYAKIYHVYDDSTVYLLPWKKFPFINVNGKSNKLSIIQRNKQWYFSINEHPVFTCKAMPFHDYNVGIEVNKRMHIVVDYLRVLQTREPINLVPDLPPNLMKEAITSVNSEYSEISPRLSPDGKTLFIVRKHHPGNLSEKDDVWYSEFINGNWSEMKNFGPPINNEGHNMVVSVSPDNNSLLLMNTYTEDGSQKGAGVSISKRTASGWSVPVNQEIDNYYNSNQYAEMCLSTNQKVLLFAIERKDTYGERDLYFSFLKPDGLWTEPKNMGADLNTIFDEGAPFVAADDKTIYFSSSGWPGYGSQDIFISKRLDNTWTKWSKPMNMGPTINSRLWDSYYTTSASGDFAIVASNHAGTHSDLYNVHLPATAKPEAVVIVHGKVLNARTRQPIEAEISYEILSNKGEAGIARSNPTTGDYKIILNYGHNYGFRAKAKGFIAVNENIELTKSGDYEEIEKNLFLVPLQAGETIKLNNVFFYQSKALLKSESYPELDRLADIMNENPNMVIEIEGHTDNQGKKKLNQELSDKRVVAVMNYLLTKGVSPRRMTGKGHGGTLPIMPNDTEENRQMNRRVEFKIIKN